MRTVQMDNAELLYLESLDIEPTIRIDVDQVPFLIGRDRKKADGVIPNQIKVIGHLHCEIIRSDAQYMVLDKESMNGTWVDGKQVLPGMSAELKDGSILRLASVRFLVHISRHIKQEKKDKNPIEEYAENHSRKNVFFKNTPNTENGTVALFNKQRGKKNYNWDNSNNNIDGSAQDDKAGAYKINDDNRAAAVSYDHRKVMAIEDTSNEVARQYNYKEVIGSRKTAVKESTYTPDEGSKKYKAKKVLIKVLVLVVIVVALAIPAIKNQTFRVDVQGGTGSNKYKGGSNVTVQANTDDGYIFSRWEADGIELTEEQATSETVSFTMPRNKVSLVAVNSVITVHVTVNNGTGSGDYTYGEEVKVVADSPEEGFCFEKWELNSDSGTFLADASSSETSFLVKEAGDIELSAHYIEGQYQLIVIDHEENETREMYTYGASVRLKAEEVQNATFTGWSIAEGKLNLSEEELKKKKLVFQMPAGDLILQQNYKMDEYKVTVKGGSGSGTYEVGSTVEIELAKDGREELFQGWKVIRGTAQLKDEYEKKTAFTMPNQSIVIESMYEEVTTERQEETLNNETDEQDIDNSSSRVLFLSDG